MILLSKPKAAPGAIQVRDSVQFTSFGCILPWMRRDRTAAGHGMLKTVFDKRMLVRQDYNADKNLNFEKQTKVNA